MGRINNGTVTMGISERNAVNEKKFMEEDLYSKAKNLVFCGILIIMQSK